jgi:hypothetical protein
MAAIRGYSRVYTKFLNALVTIQYFAFSGSDSQLGTIRLEVFSAGALGEGRFHTCTDDVDLRRPESRRSSQ